MKRIFVKLISCDQFNPTENLDVFSSYGFSKYVATIAMFSHPVVIIRNSIFVALFIENRSQFLTTDTNSVRPKLSDVFQASP